MGATAGRSQLADAVKGMAILLMVYGHTEQGALHRHWWESNPARQGFATFCDSWVYSFHMASFFLISGIFLVHSAQHRGNWGFVREKLSTLLYPYLLWAAILYPMSEPFTARYRVLLQNISIRELLTSIALGNAGWFLQTFLACQLLGLLLYRLPGWARMLIALVGFAVRPQTGMVMLDLPLRYLPFVAAGMWFGSAGLQWLEKLPRGVAAAGFALLCVAQLKAIALWGPVEGWRIVLLGLSGAAMLLALARTLEGSALNRFLCWLGAGSLAILLIHPFLQGIGRELVLRILHSTAPFPQLLVPTLLGTIVPALLWQYRSKLHLNWLFRLG